MTGKGRPYAIGASYPILIKPPGRPLVEFCRLGLLEKPQGPET